MTQTGTKVRGSQGSWLKEEAPAQPSPARDACEWTRTRSGSSFSESRASAKHFVVFPRVHSQSKDQSGLSLWNWASTKTSLSLQESRGPLSRGPLLGNAKQTRAQARVKLKKGALTNLCYL